MQMPKEQKARFEKLQYKFFDFSSCFFLLTHAVVNLKFYFEKISFVASLFNTNVLYVNYIVIKFSDNDYATMDSDEKFALVHHSGVSMRSENLYERMLEDRKKYKPHLFGMIKLYKWNVETAKEYGFGSPGKFHWFFRVTFS